MVVKPRQVLMRFLSFYTLSITYFSRFIHITHRSVKPHPLQTLHIKPAAPAGFFLPAFWCWKTPRFCRSELAREERNDGAVNQNARVIVDVLREQARSYSGGGTVRSQPASLSPPAPAGQRSSPLPAALVAASSVQQLPWQWRPVFPAAAPARLPRSNPVP